MPANDLANAVFGLLCAAEKDFAMVVALSGRGVFAQKNADSVLPFRKFFALADAAGFLFVGFLYGHLVAPFFAFFLPAFGLSIVSMAEYGISHHFTPGITSLSS